MAGRHELPGLEWQERELRCPLCDERLGDRSDAHHPACIAAAAFPSYRRPIQIAELRYRSPGQVLDLSLHTATSRRNSHSVGPSHLPAQRVSGSSASCPGCGLPLLTAHIPAGQELYTDLAFFLHANRCALKEVPAAWVMAVAASGREVASLSGELAPVPDLLPRVTSAGSHFARLIPQTDWHCALCVMRVAADGSGAHRGRCLARDPAIHTAALSPTPGQALDAIHARGVPA